jgi:hypothetical protein
VYAQKEKPKKEKPKKKSEKCSYTLNPLATTTVIVKKRNYMLFG